METMDSNVGFDPCKQFITWQKTHICEITKIPFVNATCSWTAVKTIASGKAMWPGHGVKRPGHGDFHRHSPLIRGEKQIPSFMHLVSLVKLFPSYLILS